jgi:Type I phosphodiesterase / nucleotide pyrophosphatase/Mycobacterial 4 TMS phage holin, superfamily IV
MKRLIALYRTQIELMWRWRLGRVALLKRAVVALVASLIAFNITAWLFPGLLRIEELGGGLLAVLFIAGLNLLVRPVLLAIVASRSVAALVILTLLFQAFAIWLLDPFIPAVTFTGGFIGAFVVSLVFGFLTGAISLLFGLGEDDSYYGTLVRTLASRRPDVITTEDPGLVIIQVDGLSHDVMSHSLRAGRVPNMASWIRSGSHKLGHWDALLPSTTPASQAGILHGNNDGIPNFRWWEKENGQLLVANHPEDATEIERRISNGEGLLSPGGASISNIFTGDGDRAFLVMSTIKVKERGLGQSDAFAWFFVSPYNYLTMLLKFLAEVVKENIQARRQERAGVWPHMGHHRRFPYPWVRGATNVALRAMGTSLVVQEMVRGTPVIYMDYTDYDEIAHHSGPERAESLDALDGVDRELRTLRKAADDAPRPYRFVILADHGQSLGATFLQRYGVTLQDVVRSLMGGSASVAAATAQIEDWGQLNTFLGEVSKTKGFTGSLARAVSRSSTKDGEVEMGPSDAEVTPKGAPSGPAAAKLTHEEAVEPADLIVVAGGNLALIYFNVSKERLTLEAIEEAYPDLVEALANHPGIGVLMVRSAAHGLICVGRNGIHFIEEGRVEGEDPLAVYGEHAVAAFKRLDAIDHVGDVAVVSFFDPETQEIAAFEELIGAHGGLGGAQTRPFLLYPSDWELDQGPLIGAPMVYRQLRTWMERELGMRFGLTKASADRSAEGSVVDSPTPATEEESPPPVTAASSPSDPS